MHTSDVTDDDGRQWAIHHNGDFSGDIVIDLQETDFEKYLAPIEVRAEAEAIARERGYETREFFSVKIPFAVMKELVGRYLRDEQMSQLEDASGSDYLDRLAGP